MQNLGDLPRYFLSFCPNAFIKKNDTYDTLSVFSGIFFLYNSYEGLFRKIGYICLGCPDIIPAEGEHVVITSRYT